MNPNINNGQNNNNNNNNHTAKYIGMALGVILAVAIIAAIFSLIANVTGFMGAMVDGRRNMATEDRAATEFAGVNAIDISDFNGKIAIKSGDTFTVAAENVPKGLYVGADNGTLEIYEKNGGFRSVTGFFGVKSNGIVTITVPYGFALDKLRLDSGVGSVTVEDICTHELYVDTGVGDVTCRRVTALSRASIDSGVGRAKFEDCTLNDASIDSGVGELEFIGDITGESDVNGGIGSIKLKLCGGEQDYCMTVSGGLGGVKINGTKRHDGDVVGDTSSPNTLLIDVGVGAVEVTTE